MDFCQWMPIQVDMVASSPDWLAILTSVATAIATPAIAVAGLRIAASQAKTARNALKYNLYDKRVALFECAKRGVMDAFFSAKETDLIEAEYLSGTAGARWLLDDDIADFLYNDLWSKIFDVHMAKASRPEPGFPEGHEERKNRQHKEALLRAELLKQIKVLEARFSPYLKLEH